MVFCSVADNDTGLYGVRRFSAPTKSYLPPEEGADFILMISIPAHSSALDAVTQHVCGGESLLPFSSLPSSTPLSPLELHLHPTELQ